MKAEVIELITTVFHVLQVNLRWMTWNLFLASLSVVGLRAVQIGKIVKVVPSQTTIAV